MEKNGKKFFNIAGRGILYVLCLLLIIFYVVVLYWGFTPKVAVEYKMYYLTKELTDWPGIGGLTYKFGTKEYCTSDQDKTGKYNTYPIAARKGKGWKNYQCEGSVNDGEESFVYYVFPEEIKKGYFDVELVDFDGKGYVEVFLNDISVGSVSDVGVTRLKLENIPANKLVKVKFVARQCNYTLWSLEVDKKR